MPIDILKLLNLIINNQKSVFISMVSLLSLIIDTTYAFFIKIFGKSHDYIQKESQHKFNTSKTFLPDFWGYVYRFDYHNI